MYYIDQRTVKLQGQWQNVYRFTYTDAKGARKRLPIERTPLFTERAAAEAWAETQEMFKVASMKSKKTEAMSWVETYRQYAEYLSGFGKWHAETAPNTVSNTTANLQNVVFPFFLERHKASHVEDWIRLFSAFRSFLLHEAKTMKRPFKPLSQSQRNHVVKALNRFLDYMREINVLDAANVAKCRAFDKSQIGQRDADSVISPDEFQLVHSKLCRLGHQDAADLFMLIWHTGMRISEAAGISMKFIYKGSLNKDNKLSKLWEKNGIKPLGYIALESQPQDDRPKRLDDGSIPRKPLKGTKVISEKNTRIIPIDDSDCFKMLVRRYLVQKKKYDKRTYTTDQRDYLIFEGERPVLHKRTGQVIDVETYIYKKEVFNRELKEAYKLLNLPPKTPHCGRHSKTTILTGEKQDEVLTRTITGHKSLEFERYNHIYQQYAREATGGSNQITEADLEEF